MGVRRVAKKGEGDDPESGFDHFGAHPCMAAGCGTQIPRARAFCGPHWHMLTPELKAKLNRAYSAWTTGEAGSLEKLRGVQQLCRAYLETLAERKTENGG